ncbi:hypothetical protein KR084_001081, partial [Drosophila pseudotakahashii]
QPKRNWQRSKCSVHLPRSEFVEIQPMMSEEGATSSGSGPQMTVETLSPISEMPSSSRDNSNEEPKEISVGDGCPRTLMENTTANRESSTPVSDWDERLLPSSEIGNKENQDHRKAGTTPKPKPDGMGQGWSGFSKDAFLYKNQNIPMQPSKNSSDDDDSTDRKKGAIKKRSQNHTEKTLKRVHPSDFQLKDDNPGKVLENPELKITGTTPSHPVWGNLSSNDLVFHQNLDNKIFVKTVMPNFFSNFQISSSKDILQKDPISLQTQSIAPPTNDEDFLFLENQDNRRVVETLMPELLQPAPILKQEPVKTLDPPTEDLIITMSSGRPNRNPMLSSTFVCLTDKDNLPSTSKASKAMEENVWHQDNLCDVSLRELMNPEAPLTCVDSWRSIEAICMRLRGIDVPGNVGLLKETPTFEELFEVLSIEDDRKSVPKR